MSEFIPHTRDDQRRMLSSIGLKHIEDLFADIPHEILERYEPLGIEPLSELEAKQLLGDLAAQNVDPTRTVSFLGGGVYDHHIPSVAAHLIQRSEFFTSYTPYQAEASQGTLTWMFEFQSLVCELTGLDVANGSMYDGSSALAEAMLMAHNLTRNQRFLVPTNVHPHTRRIIDTYAWAADLEIVDVPMTDDGRLDRAVVDEHASDDLGGLLIQSPNFFGVIEDLRGLKDAIGEAKLCVSAHPLSLGILKPPGHLGADIVVGEGQVFGNSPSFGGPLLGLFACRHDYIRKLPGRISGRTEDADGNVGYIMTLQTREQHIRRAKATSNICTNEALCALAGTITLATLGKRGFRKLAELNAQKAHYLAREIAQLDGFELAYDGPFFNEFTVNTPKPADQILEGVQAQGYLGGVDLAPYGHESALLVAVTEKRTRAQLDGFVDALKEAAS